MGKTKSPSAVDTALKVVPRVLLVSVTVAPGITAPWESRITPATDALVTWATAGCISTSRAVHTQPATIASRALRERTVIGGPPRSDNERSVVPLFYRSRWAAGHVAAGRHTLALRTRSQVAMFRM